MLVGHRGTSASATMESDSLQGFLAGQVLKDGTALHVLCHMLWKAVDGEVHVAMYKFAALS